MRVSPTIMLWFLAVVASAWALTIPSDLSIWSAVAMFLLVIGQVVWSLVDSLWLRCRRGVRDEK